MTKTYPNLGLVWPDFNKNCSENAEFSEAGISKEADTAELGPNRPLDAKHYFVVNPFAALLSN